MHRLRWMGAWAAVGCLGLPLVVAGCGVSGPAYRTIADAPGVRASATMVAEDCQPVWIRGDQMIFNRRQPDGHWDAYIGDTSCGDGKPLLKPVPGHLGASNVTPDGRFVLFEEDFGNPPGQSDAQPGKGVNDELVLLDRETGRVTQLTYHRLGTIWGMLNPAGTMVTWSQMVQTPLQSGSLRNYLLGVWQIHLADITPQGTLTHERVWTEPHGKGFYETYGWFGDQLMFASDVGVNPASVLGHWTASQDWLISDRLPAGAAAHRVSTPLPNRFAGDANDYHEFMTVAPAGMFGGTGSWILTSIAYQTDRGMDLWRMRPDGSGLQRVTYLNGNASHQRVPGFPAPQYAVVGGLAIDPAHPKVIYAGVSTDPESTQVNMWRIQMQ